MKRSFSTFLKKFPPNKFAAYKAALAKYSESNLPDVCLTVHLQKPQKPSISQLEISDDDNCSPVQETEYLHQISADEDDNSTSMIGNDDEDNFSTPAENDISSSPQPSFPLVFLFVDN